jgi:hypothetical protein
MFLMVVYFSTNVLTVVALNTVGSDSALRNSSSTYMYLPCLRSSNSKLIYLLKWIDITRVKIVVK